MVVETLDTTLKRSHHPVRVVRADAVHTAIIDGQIAFGADLADGDLLESALPDPRSISTKDLLVSTLALALEKDVVLTGTQKDLKLNDSLETYTRRAPPNFSGSSDHLPESRYSSFTMPT